MKKDASETVMLPIHPRKTVSAYCKPGPDLYSANCDSSNVTVSLFSPFDNNTDLILKLSDSLGPSSPPLSICLFYIPCGILLKMAVGIIWSSCFNILVKYVVDWTTLGSRESWRGGRQWDLQSVSGGATAWETVPSIGSALPVCGRELRLYVRWLFCWHDFFFPLFWLLYLQLTDLNTAVRPMERLKFAVVYILSLSDTNITLLIWWIWQL